MDERTKGYKLIAEDYRFLSPTLATLLGESEAMILQQVHFRTLKAKERGKKDNRNYQDGNYWTYDSIKGWKEKEFPFWSESKLKRSFENLRVKELLITGNYNKLNIDRTLWYRVNYENLYNMLARFGHKDLMDLVISNHSDLVTITRPIPKNSLPKKSTKTIGNFDSKIPRPPIEFTDFKKQYSFNNNDEALISMEYFIKRYKECLNKDHPLLYNTKWAEIAESLVSIELEHDETGCLDSEALMLMTDNYLNKILLHKYKATRPSICHFNNPLIKKNLFYESAYHG